MSESTRELRAKRERPLSPRQRDVLFVVSQNGPVSAADVARHMLGSPAAERSRLDGLARRGLVDRQYTGLRPGDRIGYTLTDAGSETLDSLDMDDDYDPLA